MLAAVTLAGVPGHGNWPRLMIFAAADIAMLFWKNKTEDVQVSEEENWVSLIMALEEFTGLINTPVYSWSHLERGLILQLSQIMYSKK